MTVLERKIEHGLTTMCSHISYPRFVLPLHKHKEYELMLFTQGSGKQFVGDEGFATYHTGDIALIGSNVPHLHLCNSKLVSTKEKQPKEELEHSAGEAIQFSPEIFPAYMKDLPDYRHIFHLLQKSQYGIRFYGHTLYEELKEMVSDFDSSTCTDRLICLLRMLEKLYCCKHTKLLSSTAFHSANMLPDTNDPVSKVYAFLYNHFKENVSLQDIARYVQQNPTALCRHFKRHTDKSIFQILAEIRIGHACKLLTYSDLSVSEIAYESGYNTLALFFSQFQKATGRTPNEFRAQIHN